MTGWLLLVMRKIDHCRLSDHGRLASTSKQPRRACGVDVVVGRFALSGSLSVPQRSISQPFERGARRMARLDLGHHSGQKGHQRKRHVKHAGLEVGLVSSLGLPVAGCMFTSCLLRAGIKTARA